MCNNSVVYNNQCCVLGYIIYSDMQAPTCFSTCVPSSGSFQCPCELHENSRVVYHMMWIVQSVCRLHWVISFILICRLLHVSAHACHPQGAFNVLVNCMKTAV